MKELSDVTALVIDHGLFLSVAERLSRDCKRVLYWTPWEKGFSTVNDASIGDGFENFERCNDFWKVMKDVDLVVFPDIQRSGLQLELERQGKAVWGSRSGDNLELNRQFFLKLLADLNLDVPTFKICTGITELRQYLQEKENVYVKISRFRGSLETKHFRSWDLDANLVDLWAVRFGGAREYIPFLVFDAIDTPLEIGGDSYCIDGVWPLYALHGVEQKDSAYFGAVTKLFSMPEQLREVMGKFSKLLKSYRYRNFWSMEVRVLEDKAYFIDPTCRGGLPSSGSQQELWTNYSEIIWYGANGVLKEQEYTDLFSAELILKTKADETLWPVVDVPEDQRSYLKLNDCCQIDGKTVWPKSGHDDDTAGWIVATGKTPEQVLELMKERVKDLPDGLFADIAPLADTIKNIDLGEKEGIKFTTKPMPEPEEVLQ